MATFIPYHLAIDVGARTTSAAVALSSADGVSSARVGFDGAASAPTAVFVADEEVSFGAAAVQRGAAKPERLIRDFVDRIGDPGATVAVDGETFAPADVLAWVVDDVIARVSDDRGGAPEAVWLVVPGASDSARSEAIADALARDGHGEVELISSAEALAARFAQLEESREPLTVVACDAGDDAVEATLIRVAADGEAQAVGAPVVVPLIAGPKAAATRIDEALRAAGVDLGAVDAIVLGGTHGHIAGIERALAIVFGDPIATDPEPAAAAVLGAAYLLASEPLEPSAAGAEVPTAPSADATAATVPLVAATVPLLPAAADSAAEAAPELPVETVPLEVPAASAATTPFDAVVAGPPSAEARVTGLAAPATRPARGPKPDTRAAWYRRPVGMAGIAAGAVVVAGALVAGGLAAFSGGAAAEAEERRAVTTSLTDDGAPSPTPTAVAPNATATPLPTPSASTAPPAASDPAPAPRATTAPRASTPPRATTPPRTTNPAPANPANPGAPAPTTVPQPDQPTTAPDPAPTGTTGPTGPSDPSEQPEDPSGPTTGPTEEPPAEEPEQPVDDSPSDPTGQPLTETTPAG